MLFDGEGASTDAESTGSEDAVSVFDSLLSDEPEYRETSTTPPAQSPEPAKSETDEAPADPEPAKSDEDESPDAEVPEAEQGQEPPAGLDPNLKVKLKIDGKDEEVTLDELTKGYSRTADYTRKTQAVAETRKALETETAAARQDRAQMAEHFKMLEQAIDEVRPKEPDWEKLRVEHPAEFPRVWAEWQQGEKDRAELRKLSEAAQQKVAKDQHDARQERLKAEGVKLLEAIPEWKDAEVVKAEKAGIQAFAEKHGYTLEELQGIEDHRAFVLLRQAWLYEQGQAKKTEALKRIETVKTATPGVGVSKAPVSKAVQAIQRLAKSHSQDDLAGVFMTVIDD